MASDELTGGTPTEIANMRVEHRSTRLYERHGIPFETAYCLTAIGKQPDDYDGPQRYCRRRATKRDDWDGDPYVEEAYAPSCLYHGGTNHAPHTQQHLKDPRTAPITHGLYAEDEHLHMDFNDAEQQLHDSIVEVWPDVYNWPAEDEDPARYLILQKVATNVVRTVRAEDYIDEEGEVHFRDIFDDEGVAVGEEPDENPLSREYRLLISEIVDMLGELGLTPKARQRMDTLESEAGKNDAVAEIASEALDGDHEYDPDRFCGYGGGEYGDD